ncbi:hypothetical protein EDB89DRAFT_2235920 [Lactarius sanguifluus]|nr:hypothetical protein EDB89DRAFT_2235920 [Lactarius sanguifluus]
MPHSRAALVTRTQRVPDPGGHSYEVLRRAEACATVSDHLRPTDPIPVPDLAALARSFSISTPTRPGSPRTHIRQLAFRGGLRDRLRCFTPPRPCAILDYFLALRDSLGYQRAATSTITTKLVLSPIVPKYNVHDPYLNASLNASTTVTRTVDGLDARSVRATVLHGAAAYVQSNNVTQASLCRVDFYDTFRAGADVVITVTADSCGASVPQSISTGGLATTR